MSLGHHFCAIIFYKGGQVTKPIIVMKMPCKLLYIIQVKGFLKSVLTSLPYLISKFLVTIYNAASDWPCTDFYSQAVFVYSYIAIGSCFVKCNKQKS